MKTGALFRYACHAGAMIGGASAADRAALAAFGEKLGAVFQLADDLLDVEGAPDTVGKATGKDAAAGKATLVGLAGPEAAYRRLAEMELDAVAALARLGERADVLRQCVQFAARRRS
jgi:farnesyl diphosphate synthase